VVVKVLQDKTHKDPYIRQKFQQEMEALARIEHPGVVGVLDAGTTSEGHQFIAMQFIEGTTLREAIQLGGMEPKRAARILRQIGQALSAAHEKGIWHRDLKPENVMIQNLGGEDHVKLIDFGIAAIQNSEFSGVRSMVMGSVRYMAPEQHLGHATATSDIYSFGVLAHELLTGNAPGAGSGPNLPLEVTNSIARAMLYDPAGRQQSPRILGDELAKALSGPDLVPAPSRQPAPAPPTPRRWIPHAALAALLALGLALYLWFPRSPAVPKSALQYHVMVQKYRDGQPFELPFRLSGERVFEAGYQVQLVMSSPVDGHLYILNEGPKSTPQKPDLNTMRPATLKANVEIRTPFLKFDDERGIEKVWLVWSRPAIPQLEALRKWDTGAIQDSAEAGAILALVKQFALAKVEAKRDEVNRTTFLSGVGEVLAYMISLDHE
jgi:serine/threonine protein kinase